MSKQPNYTGTRLFFLSLGGETPSKAPTGAVMTCNPDGTDLQTLVAKLGTHPDGIAVDPQSRHIYWTNMGEDPSKNDGFLSRMDLDGSGYTELIPKGTTMTPKQCTIEPRSRMLYWCDREGMRVWRAGLDGSDATVLYEAAQGDEARKDQTNHCVGIAVDAEKGKIYWTQKGPSKAGKGRLFSANMEIPQGERPGSRSDVKVVMKDLPEPIDLEFDHEAKILYKTDRGAEPRGNTVSRVHLDKDGKVQEEILASHLHEAIGLALDLKTQRMYFTDLGGSVYSANMDGSDKKEILQKVGDLTGIWCVHF